MMPCEYVRTPMFYIAFWFFAVCFDFSYRFYTHPLQNYFFFCSGVDFFQTLATLPSPRGVVCLCCHRCYSCGRTEPPFFLPCYTKLLLVFPPNCICYFSSLCLFPSHLECCCLYGAFRKQTSCSVETQYYSRLVAVHACARVQMWCSASWFWVSVYWSKFAFLSVNCRKGLDWHCLFLNSRVPRLPPALLCLAQDYFPSLGSSAWSWQQLNELEVWREVLGWMFCLLVFFFFVTWELKPVGRLRCLVWVSCTRWFWNLFLIYLFAFALVTIALSVCWVAEITHSVILNCV